MARPGTGGHTSGGGPVRRESTLLVSLLTAAALLLWGCSSTRSVPRYTSSPPEASEPMPSPGAVFEYRVSNDNCDCREYSASDPDHPVRYTFRAEYSMDSGFITRIVVGIRNRSGDTLRLDPGSVRVSSRNIDYQYNNKFIPLPDITIPPGNTEELKLDGREVTDTPSWNRIAGEQLTLTLRGLRIGVKTLREQTVRFVPDNPLLREPD